MTTAAPDSEPRIFAGGPITDSLSGVIVHRRVVALTAVAALVATAAWWVSGAAAAVPITVVGAVAIAAAVSDIRTGRIPNRLIVLALALICGSWVLVAVGDDRSMVPLLADLAAGLALSGAPAMFVIWLVAPRVLGGGDWKLLSVLGIAVGFVAPLGATVIVMIAFVAGLVVAALVRRRNVILGPPLALGYAVAVGAVTLAPDLFDNWYR